MIDVLYIKGLKANLISITQICDEDFLVLKEEGAPVLKGLKTTDNCYGVVPKPNVSCRSARVNLLELWHQRFGYANYKQMAKVSKLEAMIGLPKLGKIEKNICGLCCKVVIYNYVLCWFYSMTKSVVIALILLLEFCGILL